MISSRPLGRTGIRVSELCLGTLNFGWNLNEARSFAVLDAYYALGGRLIQAAGHTAEGILPAAATYQSEEIVGRWMKARCIPRSEIFLSTRISLRLSSEEVESGERGLRDVLKERCVESLRRFATERIDTVIFEWSEGCAHGEALLDAWSDLVRDGLVRYVGTSRYPTWRVADAIGQTYRKNLSRMEVLQANYSLMNRARFEPDMRSLCEDQRLGFFATSPLAGGFLAKSSRPTPALRSSRHRWLGERFGNAYGQVGTAAVAQVAQKRGLNPAQVALAWVLNHPQVTSAVVGVGTPGQLKELAAASAITLEHEDRVLLARASSAEEITLGRRGGMPGFRPPPLRMESPVELPRFRAQEGMPLLRRR
ncbi:MAG TPA: aldo/keto reductase [Opitutaceae bacterium]|nr:aldo/keto reductase [Opitutaceae bacterium]